MMNYQSITLFFTVGIYLILCGVVHAKGEKKPSGKLFNQFLISVVLWAVSLGMFYVSTTNISSLFWLRAKYVAGSLIVTLILLFSFVYPQEEWKLPLWLRWAVFIPTGILAYLYYGTPYMLTQIYISNQTKQWAWASGHYFWYIYVVCYLLWGFMRLFQSYRFSLDSQRQAMRYVIGGLFFSFLLAGTTGVVLPLYNYFKLVWLGPSMIFACLVYVGYGIFKKQLVFRDKVVKQTMAYSTLFTVMLVLYFLIVFINEKLFKNVIGTESIMTNLASALTIAIMFFPLKNTIQGFIERHFYMLNYDHVIEENKMLRDRVFQTDKYKMITTLASGVAHEMKNPLTVLKGYCFYLPQRLDDKVFLTKFSNVLDSELNRMYDLVQHLMDYSKPIRFGIKKTNLMKLMNTVLTTLKNSIVELNIQILKEYDDDRPITIESDPHQLSQALLNVVTNSREAMPGGGTISIAIDKREGNEIEIRIKDLGYGVHQDELPFLFDPFYSLKDQNTGLGLSIAQGIIQSHHGNIFIESVIGEGTLVIIRLPILQKVEDPNSV
ncbi:MAG: hypothetical protein K8S27_11915 [Candidatus Omnitrophica bacterium]|nr:hypothetical protein [Candidatus Omnitrophota bacterium]